MLAIIYQRLTWNLFRFYRSPGYSCTALGSWKLCCFWENVFISPIQTITCGFMIHIKKTSITVSTAPLPTSVQLISITKTLLIVLTKNERDPPLFTGKLLIKFQNILRNTTQVIIRHRVKILFSVISSSITLERQKGKSSKMKGILLSLPVNSW